MLKEVSETGLAAHFILGSDVVHHNDRNKRGGMILVEENLEPIPQLMPLKGCIPFPVHKLQYLEFLILVQKHYFWNGNNREE
jgi:hypothetical protein